MLIYSIYIYLYMTLYNIYYNIYYNRTRKRPSLQSSTNFKRISISAPTSLTSNGRRVMGIHLQMTIASPERLLRGIKSATIPSLAMLFSVCTAIAWNAVIANAVEFPLPLTRISRCVSHLMLMFMIFFMTQYFTDIMR